MENKIKWIFRSSFGSCRPRNLSDTVEKAVYQKDFLTTTTTDHHLRPPRPFPSICRITTQVDDLSIIPKQKISERYPPFVSADSPLFPLYFAGEKIPAKTRKTKNKKKKSKSRNRSSRDLGSHFFTSSSLDTTSFDDWWFSSSSDGEQTDNDGEKHIPFSSKSLSFVSSRRFRHRPTTVRRISEVRLVPPLDKRAASTADIDSCNGEDADTLFSSKSFSSESAYRFGRQPTIPKRRSEVGVVTPLEKRTIDIDVIDRPDDEGTNTLFLSKSLSSESTRRFRHRPTIPRRRSEVGGVSPSEKKTTAVGNDKMKESFAVVKWSSDLYNDFKNSMVEMIIEKQIFAAKDLENLLKCFLNLNSDRHHGIIVEVFTDILETLFTGFEEENCMLIS